MTARQPELVLIAAVARNGAIGRGNDLLFREPADQRHFREATTGHAVVMGRRTWDSLPDRARPLPGRRNLVVSRNRALAAPGAQVCATLADALRLASAGDADRVFVVGGAQLYALALPLADTLLLTEIDADLDGDVFFPPWSRQAFELVDAQPMRSGAGVDYRFARYRRRRPPGHADCRPA